MNWQRCYVITAILAFSLAQSTLAQVDTIVQVVSGANATGGKSIGAFGYNPSNDSMYVTSFGFTGTGTNAAVRLVSNVSGVQTSTPLVSEAQMRYYFVDGNTDISTTGPTQSGVLLNPQAIGSIPAYSLAIMIDASLTRTLGNSSLTNPAATKRVYRYNLEPVTTNEEALTAFTTDVTLSEMNTISGADSTNATSNTGRQFAWSGDGQSIYFLDSSNPTTAVGGLWKYQVASGDLTRLSTFSDTNTEPAVVTDPLTNTDTIYFEGGAGAFDPVSSTVVDNTGGIDFLTHDGTTTGQRTVRVSAEAMRDFLEVTSDITIPAMSSDEDGNIYFGTTTAGRRGVYRLDPQNRLSKVVGATERAEVGSTHAQTLRMQPRTISFDGDGDGPNQPFDVTQILFADTTTRGILGANAFLPGDFDRDNTLTSSDMDLFKAKLTVRGVVNTTAADLKFDLNGNDVIDWKDVKVLQQFAGFPTGDTDLHGALDFDDLDTVGSNYGLTGKKWTDGDFASADPLYPATASDANTVDEIDLLALVDTWLNVLQQPIARHQVTSRGYTGQFLTDVLSAFGYMPGGPGDFDGNGTVDAADYVVYRKGAGIRYDAIDYADWRANFGAPAASGNSIDAVAIPEPGTASLILIGLASYTLSFRRARSHQSSGRCEG